MARQKFILQIRTGETFLYRKGGTESQVFEIRLCEKIVDKSLFVALRQAYNRFPYFNSRLREIDGKIYLVRNEVTPTPQRTRRLRPLGSYATQGNVLDVTIWDNSIFVSFHHGMCDGRGVMPFIRTLLYLYFNDLYPKKSFNVPGLRLPGEPFLETELSDPVTEGNFRFDPEKVFRVDKTAFPIPLVNSAERNDGKSWRYEFSFANEDVMRLCKANGCTPPILVAILMQRAVIALNPSAVEPILCNMVCDWRESIGLPDTFRNCVTSIYLPLAIEEKELPLSELGPRFRTLVAEQKKTDSARCSASAMIILSDGLSKLQSYDEKAATIEKFVSRPTDSFVLSYTGQARLGDLEQYVESIHVYSSGVRDFFLQMSAVNGKLIIDMVQPFLDSDYADAFAAECKKEGLACSRTGLIAFSTPKDRFISYRTLWEAIAGGWQNLMKKAH